MTVINPNFTAINSALFHLSAAFPTEIPLERISPTNPKRQQNNVSPRKARPRGIFSFPRRGTVQEYFLSLCPGRFSFTERLRVPGADSREPGMMLGTKSHGRDPLAAPSSRVSWTRSLPGIRFMPPMGFFLRFSRRSGRSEPRPAV